MDQGKKRRDSRAITTEGLVLPRKNIDVEIDVRDEPKLDVSGGLANDEP